jgi:predicted nucleic acid-binding protein
VTSVVPDASVVVAWLVEEVASARARSLPAGPWQLLAPTLLQVEVANVLITRLRRGLPVPEDAPRSALDALRAGGIGWTPDADLVDQAAAIARRHLHPIHDCLYLALARREDAMLATSDTRLAALATALAIPLWSPEAAPERT